MNLKTTEKDLLEDEDQPKSLPKQIYLLIRSNWLPILFALIITVGTIIAVPIVYTLKKTTGSASAQVLWTIEGVTVAGTLGISGNNGSLLGIVTGLAKDSSGNIYIVDQSNHRIVQLITGSSSLKHIAGNANGSSGQDNIGLNSPYDIYIDESTNIYIADTNNHRIQKWSIIDSTGVTVFGITGSAGSSLTQLRYPMSVTMDTEQNLIYIADYGNNRIVQFNLTNNISVPFLQYYSNIDRSTCVQTPISIRFDDVNKTLVIAQQQGYNVIRWNPLSPSWTLIAGSASSQLTGTSRTLFNAVCSANIDQTGNTYVADCINQRIQFYQGDLSKGRTIGGVIGANGTGIYLLTNPTATILDNDKNLYVADSNNFRIQMFKQISA